jgi:solute carrier family 25 2-oxodicarboxylate transporter 21
VWFEEGIAGFYKGLESTIWRNGVWNATYFGLIHDLNKRFALPPEKKTRGRQLFVDFLVGFIAGVAATTLNTPFDVVKSRIQSVRTQTTGPRKYNWSLPSLFTVWREEG